jgi:hypothetical protein
MLSKTISSIYNPAYLDNHSAIRNPIRRQVRLVFARTTWGIKARIFHLSSPLARVQGAISKGKYSSQQGHKEIQVSRRMAQRAQRHSSLAAVLRPVVNQVCQHLPQWCCMRPVVVIIQRSEIIDGHIPSNFVCIRDRRMMHSANHCIPCYSSTSSYPCSQMALRSVLVEIPRIFEAVTIRMCPRA